MIDTTERTDEVRTALRRFLVTTLIAGALHALHLVAMIKLRLYPATRFTFFGAALLVLAFCLWPGIGLLRARRIGAGLGFLAAGFVAAWMVIFLSSAVVGVALGGFGTW